MTDIKPIIQAILFSSPNPIMEDEILGVIQKEISDLTMDQLQTALAELMIEYKSDRYGMEIQHSGMGFSFVSKPQFYPFIVNYIETIQRRRLSKAALETLSIVAFQPDCTKYDIEIIRGVSADYAIDKLIERELVYISGRKDSVGQPSTYRTTSKFLDYFGIESVDDLPRLSELNPLDNELGETNEV